MVKEEKRRDKMYYCCEACGYVYTDKKLAKKCEDWCKKHKSCNIKITKYAIGSE